MKNAHWIAGWMALALSAGHARTAEAAVQVTGRYCLFDLGDEPCVPTSKDNSLTTGGSIALDDTQGAVIDFSYIGFDTDPAMSLVVTHLDEGTTPAPPITENDPVVGEGGHIIYTLYADDRSPDEKDGLAFDFADQEYKFEFLFVGDEEGGTGTTDDDDDGTSDTTTTTSTDKEITITVNVTLDDVPQAIENVEALPGENELYISWDRPKDWDLKGYEIYYDTQPRPNAVPGGTGDEDYANGPIVLLADKGSLTDYTLTDLENGVTYYVNVRAVDDGNKSGEFFLSEASATPSPVLGLGDLSGSEEGCFVATAASGRGSWTVKVLTQFRDLYLKKTPAGMAFVRWYYRNSPPAAAMIAQRPVLRTAMGLALLPPAFVAGLMVGSPSAWSLAAVTVLALGAFFLHRRRRLPASAALGALLLCGMGAATEARAYEQSPKNIWLTFKAGGYNPKNIPMFEHVYTDDKGVVLGVDGGFELVDFYSVLSLGGSLAYYKEDGLALIQDASLASDPAKSGKEVHWHQFNGQAFLSLDLRFWEDQPLVPFGRAGYDGVYFRETGNGSFNGGGDGFFWAAGGKFLLDLLDPQSARTFDADYGINNTYLTAEYVKTDAKKDKFFDFETGTVYGGLTLEF